MSKELFPEEEMFMFSTPEHVNEPDLVKAYIVRDLWLELKLSASSAKDIFAFPVPSICRLIRRCALDIFIVPLVVLT